MTTSNQEKALRWAQKHYGNKLVYSDTIRDIAYSAYYAGLVDKEIEELEKRTIKM